MSLALQYANLFNAVSYHLGMGNSEDRLEFTGRPFPVTVYTQGTSPAGPQITWTGDWAGGYGLFPNDLTIDALISGVYVSVFLVNGGTSDFEGTFAVKKLISANVFEIDHAVWGSAPTNATSYRVRNLNNISADERLIHEIINGGLRKFYYPVIDSRPHRWGFLHNYTMIATIAGRQYYDLPTDFAWPLGNLTFQAGTMPGSAQVQIVSPAQYESMIQHMPSGHRGIPTVAAVLPKPSSDVQFDGTLATVAVNRPTRYQLHLFPFPDKVYNLYFSYHVEPDECTWETPDVWGGQAHHETIRAAVVAEADIRVNGAMGVQQANYERLLANSIAIDQRAKAPTHIGYNGDRSDRMGQEGYPSARGGRVTYNGQYSD